MASPKVPNTKVPNAKIRIEDVITKDGKFESDKFWKLTDVQIADLIGDAVHNVRTYIMQPSTHKEAAASVRLLEALDKENPDLGLSHYVTLFKSIESGNGSALTRSYFDSLKQYDPDTFNLYLEHPGWEAFDRPDFDFTMYRAENAPKDVEPSAGALTDKPLNNASPSATPSGVLTEPPAKLPEVNPQTTPPNVGRTIEEAEAEAYPPIDDGEISGNYYSPTSPGVHIRVINAEGKPVDLTPEEIAKFKPDSASPSPEVVGEAMRDAIAKNPKDLVGDTTLKSEDIPAFLTKEKNVKAAEETAKTEAAAEPKVTPDAETEGALTGNRFKDAFIKTGDFLKKHPKSSIGGLLTLVAAGYGVSQLPKLASLSETKVSNPRNRNEESRSNNINYRVWENYTPDYLNEEYVPGKIPSHIPQDYLPSIKESAASKKVKSQPQIVSASAPENNATADYVRAAYNSYIPSDAGRAYQKAIYGDPLELERMRLQQQQQKWRDFVMRSGQSPAELVQRGLMPYDALQYI